jgi:hypothetical protein
LFEDLKTLKTIDGRFARAKEFPKNF